MASKNHQNLNIFKGVSPWFLLKNGDFLIPTFYAKWTNKQCFLKVPKQKNPFQTIKTSAQKNHQTLHFFKGVSPWFLLKNGDFLIPTFYAKWTKKQCFLKVPKEKKPFQTIKTSAQKTTKICIFSKGLVHGFCQKIESF